MPPAGGDAAPRTTEHPRTTSTGLERFTRLVRRQLSVPVSLVVADPDDLPSLDLGIQVVSWAGTPVVDARGEAMGHLCAVDDRPRAWTEPELATLRDLAAACSSELRLLEAEAASTRARCEAELAARRSRLLLTLSEALIGPTTVEEVTTAVLGVARGALETESCAIFLTSPEDGRLVLDRRHDDAPDWLAARLAEQGVGDDEVFPAQVVRTGEPLFIDDMAPLALLDPRIDAVFAGEGFQRWAFVPLVDSSGAAEGALAMSWPTPRPFTGEEQDTLCALGRYTGQALQRARLLEDVGDVARTLQASLLTALPAREGLELEARYCPAARAHDVGGDWYDAFGLPGGGTALVIGDVTGHDLSAAASMGALRSMLRALAFEHPDSPAEAVRRLDTAAVGLGGTALTTLVCAAVGPPGGTGEGSRDGSRTVRWTSAGHLPPLLLLPDGGVRELTTTPELLVGVAPEHVRTDHAVTLPPGAVLLLYTDGLVERRGEDLTDGLARLGAALAGRAGQDPAALLTGLLEDLVPEDAEDDVAVLAVRVRAPVPAPAVVGDRGRAATLPRVPAAARRARVLLTDVLAGASCTDPAGIAELLVCELATNAIRYGRGDGFGLGLGVRRDADDRWVLRVEVTDASPLMPRPRHAAPSEESGRGLELVSLTSTAWGAQARGAGKVVWCEVEVSPARP